MKTTPFQIGIATAELRFLRQRLRTARRPAPFEDLEVTYGVDEAFLDEALAAWRDGFDWRRSESELNQLPQFKANVEGVEIHFVHVKGVQPNSPAILLTHGWPGSFIEFRSLIPMLTNPAATGFSGFGSFDVVIPSIPGFGFSDAAKQPGMTLPRVAELFKEMMSGLGYDSFYLQGGDLGAGISVWLARLFPRAVLGLHLNYIPGTYAPENPDEISAEGQDYLRVRDDWIRDEGGYSHVHSTKPQTLAYALTDSPVGLAAWILEKFASWSDWEGKVTDAISMNDLLTNLSIYWFTRSIGSSMRLYKEVKAAPLLLRPDERIARPTHMAKFPKELPTPPRAWVERSFNLVRWTEMPKGGHFAALEQPRVLAGDILEAFSKQR